MLFLFGKFVLQLEEQGEEENGEKDKWAKAIGLHFLSGPKFPFLFLKKEGLQAIHTLDVARLRCKTPPAPLPSLPSSGG